ncbi:MAG TPA: hypothetical protein VJA22_02265 [Patescibacteria group bacterium]|nr:hypothetical protein [Patescibacteria group bacterium]
MQVFADLSRAYLKSIFSYEYSGYLKIMRLYRLIEKDDVNALLN